MYSIYHIPGVKIGCTDNVERRIIQQSFTNYEILEEHTDIFIASDREIQLQKQYGYKVDIIPYWKSVERWGARAGKIGGKRAQSTLKKNKLGLYTDNIELRRQWQKLSVDVVKEKYGKEHYSNMGKKSGINALERAKIFCKKIIAIDINGNKTEYNSITEAAKVYNVSNTAISNNLRGKTKLTKGIHFEYAK